MRPVLTLALVAVLWPVAQWLLTGQAQAVLRPVVVALGGY